MKKFLFIVSLIFIFVLPSAVNAAGFYFLPQEKKSFEGDTFIADLMLDTNGIFVNVIKVGFVFPKETLEIIDFLTGSSAVDLWIKKPEILNNIGKMSFVGGGSNPFGSRDIFLGKVLFRAKKSGLAKISFQSDSEILSADGFGGSLPLENIDGLYEVVPRPLSLPQVGSNSHPDSDRWYPSPNLEVHWDVKEGAEYSYILSKDPLAAPDEKSEIITGAIEYFGLDDGIYYFILREKMPNKGWGESTNFRAMIDTAPPLPFELSVAKRKDMFRNNFFLVFNTTDNASGVDYFAVCEKNQPCFFEAKSPYVLENQWLGKEIIVKAYDKAGHFRVAKIKPSFAIPAFILLCLIVVAAVLFFAVFLILLEMMIFWRLNKK